MSFLLKNNNVRKIYLYLALFLLLIFPQPAISQSGPGALSLETVPSYPEAFQDTKVNLKSATLNLKTAQITWSVNGSPQASGTGLQTFNLTTGNLGQESLIEVDIVLPNNERREISRTINPINIDLFWHAKAYNPFFYKGRTLAGQNSTIKIEAMPFIYSNGQRLDPSSLIYRWQKNGQTIPGAFGVGQNSIEFEKSLARRSDNIFLTVSNQQGQTVAATQKTISTFDPEVWIYKTKNSRTLHQKALNIDNQTTTGNVSLIAKPFFFSINNMDDLTISWQVDGQQLSGTVPERISFEFSEQGLIDIFVLIQNQLNSLQNAQFMVNNFNFQRQ